MNERQFILARRKLNGERGLLLSVIHQAVFDAHYSSCEELRKDALAYFKSDVYQQHLALLGLPENWKPTI